MVKVFVLHRPINPLDPIDFPPNMRYFPKISTKFARILSKYTNSKLCRNAYIHDKEMIPTALNRAFHQL